MLRGAINLIQTDVVADEFQPNLKMVLKTYQENEPQVTHNLSHYQTYHQPRATICIPFGNQKRVQGVLYHDNSYVDDCFDDFEKSQLTRMAQALNQYITQILEFCQRLEQKRVSNLGQLSSTSMPEIITRNPDMLKLLDQTDQIASTDSTVLILGETGVGKDLLARRIHHMSVRLNQPFVVVEPSAMPENLVESELFGHEKGVFTGADRRKMGRLELAHQGTLFIDEVGEIPLSIQVKLLRVLQENPGSGGRFQDDYN